MQRLFSFEKLEGQFSLTIGNFDGVHLGHAAVLKRLVELSPKSCVITFSNHPSEVLQKKVTLQIVSLSHRVKLFEAFGVTQVISIPFTESFSLQSAEQFLTMLKEKIPFSHLILGHDAAIGYKREGDANVLSILAEKLDFTLEYLEPVYLKDQIVSSRAIRASLRSGDLKRVHEMLGRPYSVFGKVTKGAGFGKTLGFPTANIPVIGLELPPFGIYAVEVIVNNKSHLGVADLGVAPTMHVDRPPLLEVHILDFNDSLYNQEIEVVFLNYLRPEFHFSSLDELKKNIQLDIERTRQIKNNRISLSRNATQVP